MINEVLNPQQITKEAQSAYKAGDYVAAAQSFEAARQGYLSANDLVMAAEMANNVSVALLQAGDAQSALHAVEGTDIVFNEAGERKRQAMALGNRAAALEALKRSEEAEQAYWQSAQILKELGEEDLRLSVMQSISALQLRTGKQFQAVATMHSGMENLEKPTPKQRFLKRLLNIPMNLLNKQQVSELEDGNDHDS
jgi:tetratricopeptide (TPR) repeat protein